MLLSKLPGELISRILTYIDDDSLYECMKTCKQWHRLGAVRYYKEITLYNNHKQFLEYTKMLHPDSTRIGEYVQSLTFTPRSLSKNQVLTQEQFTDLLSNLPNLRTIHFNSEHDAQTIVDYMIYFKIVARHTNIQEITIPDEFDYGHTHGGYLGDKKARKIRRYHYMANRILHSQITSFTLADLDVRMLKGSANRLLGSLAKFKNLKRFSVYVNDQKEYYESPEDLQVPAVLKVCPKLEFLEYKSSTKWADNVPSNPYLNFTSLTLQLPSIDKKNVQYLLHHLPNLKRFDLDMYHRSSLSELYKSLDPTTATQFVSFLKQLDYLKIHGTSFDNEQDHSLFWGLIRDIYDNNMKCNLAIEFWSTRQFTEDVSFDKAAKIFEVSCDWILQNNFDPDWIHLIDFFDFASYQIQYHNREHGNPGLQGLMHPLLLQKQAEATFFNYDQYITIHDHDDRPTMRCVHFVNLVPFDSILSPVETYYPYLEEIVLQNCLFLLKDEKSNHYMVDLRLFKNVHLLTFDIDTLLDEEKTILEVYIQFINGDKVDYYQYKEEQRIITHVADFDDSVITNDTFLVKIYHEKLGKFEFRRDLNTLDEDNRYVKLP